MIIKYILTQLQNSLIYTLRKKVWESILTDMENVHDTMLNEKETTKLYAQPFFWTI